MRPFLRHTDYLTRISGDILEELLSIASNVQLSTAPETHFSDRAVAKLKLKLGERYDVEAMFNPDSYEHRDETLISWALDIAVYEMCALIDPEKVNQIVKTRYKEVMSDLDLMLQSKLNPQFPLKNVDNEDYSPVVSASNKPFFHRPNV